MNGDDLVVGLAAGLIGGVMLFAAALNHDLYYRYVFARLIDARFGRTAARVFYVVLGAALLAIGVAILLGLRPTTTMRTVRRSPVCHVARSGTRPIGDFPH